MIQRMITSTREPDVNAEARKNERGLGVGDLKKYVGLVVQGIATLICAPSKSIEFAYYDLPRRRLQGEQMVDLAVQKMNDEQLLEFMNAR